MATNHVSPFDAGDSRYSGFTRTDAVSNKFQIFIDCPHFVSDDFDVSIISNAVAVKAVHEDSLDHGVVRREVNFSYSLTKEVVPRTMQWHLTSDYLVIEFDKIVKGSAPPTPVASTSYAALNASALPPDLVGVEAAGVSLAPQPIAPLRQPKVPNRLARMQQASPPLRQPLMQPFYDRAPRDPIRMPMQAPQPVNQAPLSRQVQDEMASLQINDLYDTRDDFMGPMNASSFSRAAQAPPPAAVGAAYDAIRFDDEPHLPPYAIDPIRAAFSPDVDVGASGYVASERDHLFYGEEAQPVEPLISLERETPQASRDDGYRQGASRDDYRRGVESLNGDAGDMFNQGSPSTHAGADAGARARPWGVLESGPPTKPDLGQFYNSETQKVAVRHKKDIGRAVAVAGNLNESFNQPIGCTRNESNGDIIICDTKNNVVKVFDQMFAPKLMLHSASPSGFVRPSAVVALPDLDAIAVKDDEALQLFSIANKGAPIGEFGRANTCAHPMRPKQTYGLTRDANGFIVFVEHTNSRTHEYQICKVDVRNLNGLADVQRVSVGDPIAGEERNELDNWNRSAPGPSGQQRRSDVGLRFIDAFENQLVTSDWALSHMYVFDMNDGAKLAQFGRKGKRAGELNQPSGVQFDGCGNVMVGNSGAFGGEDFQIQVFRHDDHTFASAIQFPREHPLLRMSSVYLATNGELIVNQYNAHFVSVYELVDPARG